MDGFQHQQGQAPEKFSNPDKTLDGSARAEVRFNGLETLWINTGTLCNIECANCYIESSPTNDRLSYITADEAASFIDDAIAAAGKEIGFTGGEPFMNPAIFDMLERVLAGGLKALVLTNAMRPMMRPAVQEKLKSLNEKYSDLLTFRISLDHFTEKLHDEERGAGSFDQAMVGLRWLAEIGANLSIAGRSCLSESEDQARAGYQELFGQNSLPIDAHDLKSLVLFPEMGEVFDPPEITTECWDILKVDPNDMMCASSRMVVKRKGDAGPSVLACTLIPYDDEFIVGSDLEEASAPIKLNHRNCATFCVLGGSSCSG